MDMQNHDGYAVHDFEIMEVILHVVIHHKIDFDSHTYALLFSRDLRSVF